MSTQSPRLMKGAARTGIIVAIVALALVVWGIFSRHQAMAALNQQAQTASVTNVLAAKPNIGASTEDLTLPGNIQAYSDAPIYARTSGYMKRWYVDIGTTVKAGQLLAEIDTPEVEQQVDQGKADLRNAEANNQLAQSTAERWKGLVATNSVSKQDADVKISDAASKLAALGSARANLKRLNELQGFRRIVAPFDGVITARNTDIGQLIDAGSSTGTARELFHIAAIDKLRIFVQVPQSFAGTMKPGLEADLVVTERPGQHYPAKVVRTADAIDPTTRTLLVELAYDNSKRDLLAGGYTAVHFKVETPAGVLRLPANALLFQSAGMVTAVIGTDNKVTLTPITMGHDFGKEVEVLSGIGADQTVVINPPDSLTTGQLVHITSFVKAPDADKAAGGDKK